MALDNGRPVIKALKPWQAFDPASAVARICDSHKMDTPVKH